MQTEQTTKHIVECKNGHKYDVNNDRFRLLKNGAVYDNKLKHIVGISIDGHAFNQDNAREAGLKRWQAARQAAAVGLSRVNGSKTSLDAWSKIVEKQAELSLSNDVQTRDTTNAAAFVGRATGFIPTQIDITQEQQTQDSINISITGDIAHKLIQILDKQRHGSDNIHYTKHKSGQIVDV